MSGSNISTGADRAIFEDMFRDYIGVPYALSVANGTVALELVWETLIRNGKLKKGDKVLLPSFTFVACANSVVQSGLVPVFCDIDKESWNLDFQWDNVDISGVLAVHTFGNPADCDEILYLKDNGLIVVEDCAEATGASYNGRMCGSFGDASIFSFNATKNLTTGEGGMACFRDKEDAETALLLAENGFGYTSRNAIIPGHNYRLANILCAVGIEQLKTLDKRNLKRLQNAHKILTTLKDAGLQGKVKLQEFNKDNVHSYQIFGILVEDRDKVYEHMIKSGVEVKKYFDPPCHAQQFYHNNYVWPDLPNTDYISQHILCLPMYPSLTDKDIGIMVNALKEVV
jgi:dTDP-4-amino-4,6-dideoxygalactose transaminase